MPGRTERCCVLRAAWEVPVCLHPKAAEGMRELPVPEPPVLSVCAGRAPSPPGTPRPSLWGSQDKNIGGVKGCQGQGTTRHQLSLIHSDILSNATGEGGCLSAGTHSGDLHSSGQVPPCSIYTYLQLFPPSPPLPSVLVLGPGCPPHTSCIPRGWDGAGASLGMMRGWQHQPGC